MSTRSLPLQPNLEQLRHQAKDLLRDFRNRDASAIAEFGEHHPSAKDPENATLAEAQLVLARMYQASSWMRLVQACNLIDAIWRDDPDTVRDLVTANPRLLHESATIRESNWGPPMSYAANVGRDRIIAMLHELGAKDSFHAFDRAILQGRTETAKKLHAMMGSPVPAAELLGGAAYTLSVPGTALLFELGTQLRGENGVASAPVSTVLETDSRNPTAKHAILEMYSSHGFEFPDTPIMALHRGRLDLLDAHIRRDPGLLSRAFSYEEIFPPELGCHGEDLPRTTLHGATLLHVCVEFDELDIAKWLIERGMSADVLAATDASGFGGHTPLFAAVVSYPNFWGNYKGGWTPSPGLTDSPFARLLLDSGADPNAIASFKEQIWNQEARSFREHRNLTPLDWGTVFHNRMIVSDPAMRIIGERGGKMTDAKGASGGR